jgi:putative flippase GtrA
VYRHTSLRFWSTFPSGSRNASESEGVVHRLFRLTHGEGRIDRRSRLYGYEFINHIDVRQKYAIDLNPSAHSHLSKDVTYELTPADELGFIPDNTLDRVFTSNFLEHLRGKAARSAVLKEVLCVQAWRKFIILGPNVRYLYDEYWDFHDHFIPLSHVSLAEGLSLNGFAVEEVIVRLYLALPGSGASLENSSSSPGVSLACGVARQPFVGFAIGGAVAAVTNVVARIVFRIVVPYEIAIALALPFGLTTAFILNSRYVFGTGRSGAATAYWRFTFVNLVALVQVWIVNVFLDRMAFPGLGFTWHAETTAHTARRTKPRHHELFRS